jgi:transposase
VNLEQLVFIDEFGATTNMTRTRARGPKGQRIVCKTPHGHWKILSTIAAMSVQGMITGLTFDGATDTETFVAFVQRCLVPVLQAGQVVVLDNLSAHKSPRVDALVKSRGARVLRLPPYSPDYNPIEMAISKMKALLRKLARRDVPGLLHGVTAAMNCITESDARGFMRHSGYATKA